MLKEQRISFETAKLAKEKDFFEGFYLYNEDGKLWKTFLISEDERKQYAAPTQSLLQKWLRDVHQIHVFIGYRPNRKVWDSHAYSLNTTVPEYVARRNMRRFVSEPVYNSYEEALEAGLIEGLNQINLTF